MATVALASPDQVNAYRRAEQSCRRNPGWFATHIVGERPWSKQRDLRQAVMEHRMTLCASAHGVGKSHSLATLVLEFGTFPRAFFPHLRKGFSVKIVCTASTNQQVHDVLWGEVQRQHHRAAYPLGGRVMEREWRIARGRKAVCVSTDQPVALQGKHADAVLIVVDEAEHLRPEDWDALMSLMSGENCRMVLVYNPVHTSGVCYDLSQRPDLCHQMTISALDHPNVVKGREVIPGAVTRTWIEEVRAKEGEGSPYWQARVLGVHPTEGTNQLVTIAALQQNAGGIKLAQPEPKRAGLDVARFGDDWNIAVAFDEHRNLRAVERWHGSDLVDTAGRFRAFMTEHGVSPEHAGVDVCGIGAGVVDTLHANGVPVTAVDFGGGPEGDWPDLLAETGFVNRRAELHWALRYLVRQGAIGIGEEYREVWADLVAPTYRYDAKNRVLIEAKEAIKKRIGRSPDHGDAVVIALANTGGNVIGCGWAA